MDLDQRIKQLEDKNDFLFKKVEELQNEVDKGSGIKTNYEMFIPKYDTHKFADITRQNLLKLICNNREKNVTTNSIFTAYVIIKNISFINLDNEKFLLKRNMHYNDDCDYTEYNHLKLTIPIGTYSYYLDNEKELLNYIYHNRDFSKMSSDEIYDLTGVTITLRDPNNTRSKSVPVTEFKNQGAQLTVVGTYFHF